MRRSVLLAGSLLALLAACGQKGGLYLPGEEGEAVMGDPVSVPGVPAVRPPPAPASPPADATTPVAPPGATPGDEEDTPRRAQ